MKLISLNIEGARHFDTVIPFLEHESPDVIALQEIFEKDIERIAALGYHTAFLPMTYKSLDNTSCLEGAALFTKAPHHTVVRTYYSKYIAGIPTFTRSNIPASVAHGILMARIPFDGDTYTVGTTHFTWTPHGERPNTEQKEDVQSLIQDAQSFGPHVLCGDFNIPRTESPLYASLADFYTDAIPHEYASSLDKNLHRHGTNPELSQLFEKFMVDYVFTKNPYRATDVRLEFGVSDHAAVIATITKHAHLLDSH